ncbi:hypothetical protein ACT51I_00220 [Pseudomonas aeruginosa]
MIDDSIFEKIDNLIGRLSASRSTADENELCRIARVLSGDRKLDVVERLGITNARLAASVARRIHLPVEQQLVLVDHLLNDNKSNAIKQFTLGLFVFRLSSRSFIEALIRVKDKCPDSVRLMAYYYSAGSISCRYKALLASLVSKEKSK